MNNSKNLKIYSKFQNHFLLMINNFKNFGNYNKLKQDFRASGQKINH